MNKLKYGVYCNCGGSISFNVDSVSFDKQYNCPNCGNDLGVEVLHVLVNIKDSLKHHCESCSPLTNVRNVQIRGQLL